MNFNLVGKSILVVEDHSVMRKAIRDMLYTLNADSVAEADSGAAAINAMSASRFDAVLCDYNLGVGQNGQQVLEEARFRKLISFQCVFIIISEEQTASMVLGAMDGRPDEYLAKPFNAKQLLSRLQRNFVRKQFLLSVEKEIERGNLLKAIENCDGLLAAKGDKQMHTLLLKQRAELAINTEDFVTAGKIYHEILAQRQLPWAKLGLGVIEFKKNNIESAIAVFEELLRESPMLMEAYDWLSKAYEASNKLHEVQTVLFQAVDLSPQSILRQKRLAEIADKNGNLDVAEKAYRATVSLGKNSIHKSCSDFAGLAKLYSKTNATDSALRTLASMRLEFDNNPEAELWAATVETELYKNLGNEELSILALQKVLSLNKNLEGNIPKDLLLDMARACFLSNQDETANEILYGLIKTHIDDEVFLNDVRRMQKGIGMDNHSEILIQKTKHFLIVANNKGVELYQKGKFKESLELFEQAIVKMPDNKTIIFNMLKIIIQDLKAGDFNKDKLLRAKKLFNKATQVGIEPHKLAVLKGQFTEVCRQRLVLSGS